MKIWKLKFELDKYENLAPVKDFTWQEFQEFDGRRLRYKWKPLPVERMNPEKKLPLSDAPGFTIPVFSKRALDILLPCIQDCVEILELVFDEHDEQQYFGINVISVLNVIDYEKAEYIRFQSSGRIMLFTKYAFKECDDLKEYPIFKLVDEPRREPFVSEAFKDLVEQNNLTGFKFELVWDSEQKEQH